HAAEQPARQLRPGTPRRRRRDRDDERRGGDGDDGTGPRGPRQQGVRRVLAGEEPGRGQRDGDERDDREDGGGRRGAAVPADDEQRDDEQVEGHLVGQRPQDVHRVGDVEQVLQHGGVREDGGGGGVLLESGPESEDAQQVG